MSGPCHGAVLGHRVVDGIQAGRAQDAAVGGGAVAFLVHALDEVVEASEEFVGRQVQGGEVVHGRAQPTHGGGGVQAVPDDVSDDESDAASRQRDHVEPVPAHTGLGGLVEMRDIHGTLLGQVPWQQAALERHGEMVFARVAAGVVHGDRGAADELLRQGQVVLVERFRLLPPPEVDHAQHDAPGLQRSGDERVDPVGDDLRCPARVLGVPARRVTQIRYEFDCACAVTAGLRRGRQEVDQSAERVQRVIGTDAVDRRAPHVGARAGLVAVHYRVGQIDRHEVREPGDGDVGQLLRGPHHVECGADVTPGVVQQLEPLPGRFRPAAQELHLGGVADGDRRALRAAPGVGGSLIDDEQPVPGLQHLVSGDPAGQQQVRHPAVHADLVDGASLGVVRQVEQSSGFVVRQEQPSFAVGDQHPFADGVEHRVVVLVHAGHLLRAEPVGLAAESSADQRRADGGQRQAAGDGREDDRKLFVGDAGHALHRQARRYEGDDIAIGRGDRHDRLDLLAERSLHTLGVHPAVERGLDRADEPLADAIGLRVAVADAAGVHHHDEVHPCGLARLLGERLQNRGRVRHLQRFP